MHVTVTYLQNGEPAYLARSLSVPAGGQEVALCELMYYHQWHNISAALETNQVSNRHTTAVPDGYYNVCELIQPLETELNVHAPIGRLQRSTKKRLVLNSAFAILLGFLAHLSYRLRMSYCHWPVSVVRRASCDVRRASSVVRRASSTIFLKRHLL